MIRTIHPVTLSTEAPICQVSIPTRCTQASWQRGKVVANGKNKQYFVSENLVSNFKRQKLKNQLKIQIYP
jgi:hypothetical protein